MRGDEGSEECARILVVDANAARARTIVLACGASRVELVDPSTLARRQLASRHCDLALTSIEADHFDVVMSCYAALDFPEMAFYALSESDPAFSALKLLCPERLVLLDDIVEWLAVAMEPLVQLCKARRLERRARTMMDRLATRVGRAERPPSELSLYAAEGRFRETYLRAVLQSSNSCREAAVKAGVPYRTFMYMINKLGVRDAEERGGAVPSAARQR